MDPANAKFVCGAECGIAVTGTASAGVEHWSTVFGAPTVVTSGPSPMRSTRCFRFNAAAARTDLETTYAIAIASPATTVARCYVYFATLPSGADCGIVTTSGQLGVWWHNSSGTLRGSNGGADFAASGFTPVTGVWYRIDMKAVTDATRTVDFQVDGVAQTQMSVASAAAADAGVLVGVIGAATADLYIDDILVSGTSAEYPIGEGIVAGLYPNGDRTNTLAAGSDDGFGHVYSATTDFGKGAGGATATGAQNAESTSWQSLDNPLTTTAGGSWIADLLGVSTEHMVWTMDNLPASAVAVNGVMVVATTHSASATTNQEAMRLINGADADSTNKTLLFQTDLSELTITVPVVIATVCPGFGTPPWTPARVNGVLVLWGDSNDVNPDPYLDGVCIEVDYLAPPEQVLRPYGQSHLAQLLPR